MLVNKKNASATQKYKLSVCLYLDQAEKYRLQASLMFSSFIYNQTSSRGIMSGSPEA
jgi:hypothetical protein